MIGTNDSYDWLVHVCPSLHDLWRAHTALGRNSSLSENTVVILEVFYILCTKSSGPNFICFDTLVHFVMMILWHSFTSCLSYGYSSTLILWFCFLSFTLAPVLCVSLLFSPFCPLHKNNRFRGRVISSVPMTDGTSPYNPCPSIKKHWFFSYQPLENCRNTQRPSVVHIRFWDQFIHKTLQST